MTTIQDWEQWQGSWQGDGEPISSGELRALIRKTARTRRAITATRLLSGVVAVFALLIVAGALRHAGNTFERTLGVIVGVGIVGAWLFDASNRRHALDKVESGPEEYAAVRRELCTRRIRFAYLGWVVVALDFVFLIPWWIGGVKVHGAGLGWTQVQSIWAPIVMMIAFVLWTIRVRTSARVELDRL